MVVNPPRNIKSGDLAVARATRQQLKSVLIVGGSQSLVSTGMFPRPPLDPGIGQEGRRISRAVLWARLRGGWHCFHPHPFGQTQAHATSECEGDWKTCQSRSQEENQPVAATVGDLNTQLSSKTALLGQKAKKIEVSKTAERERSTQNNI